MLDVESPLFSSGQNEKDLSINAMFPSGQRKTYYLNFESKIEDLITLIRNDNEIDIPKDKILCVMYRGRILQNNEKISDLDTITGFTLSILFRMAQKESKNIDRVHELRGFDRLERMNYSSHQIHEIRRQFHLMRGGINDSLEEKYNAEEEWLPIIFNSENPLELFQTETHRPEENQPNFTDDDSPIYEYVAYNRAPSSYSFIVGFFLGAIFGPASLFFLIVSYKETVGIGGICFGLLFYMRSYFYSFFRSLVRH